MVDVGLYFANSPDTDYVSIAKSLDPYVVIRVIN